MSIKQMIKVWEHQFSHPKQSVMLALADHAHDDGTNVRPSIDYIAWKTGYSRRSVQNIIYELKAEGILVLARASDRRTPNEYKIDWNKATTKRPFVRENRGAESAPHTKNRGAVAVQVGCSSGAGEEVRGAIPVHLNAPLLHPNLLIEPSTLREPTHSTGKIGLEPGAGEVALLPAANSQIEPIEALPTSQPEPVAETRENPFPGQPKNPDLAVENKVVPPPCDTLDAVVDSDAGESVPGPWNFDRQAARFDRHPSPILRHYGIGYMAIARKGAFVEFSLQLVEGVKAVSGAWSTPLTCDGDAIAHLRNRLSQLLDERHYEAALGFLQQAWERGEDAISEAQEAQERASIPEFVPRPIPAFSEGELGFLQGKGSFAAVIKGRSSSRRAS